MPPDPECVRDRLRGRAAVEDDGLAIGDPLRGRSRDALFSSRCTDDRSLNEVSVVASPVTVTAPP